MTRILSQEEIDSLLSGVMAAERSTGAAESVPSHVVSYNFRRPDRVSKDQIRSLHLMHERFARNVTTSLSAFLRIMTDVSIVSVEQFAYSEFLMSLPDPTVYYAIGLQPFEALGALELTPAVAFTAIDRMLGGTGHITPPQRALTEIEQNVSDTVVKLLLDNLSETWKPIGMQFAVQARETRPQMLQVCGPNEVVILVVFEVRIAEARGVLNLCIPAAVIESMSGKFAQGRQRSRREPTADERDALFRRLGRMAMPVTAAVETTIPAQDLVALKPGHVLSLGRPATLPIHVQVGAATKFLGRLVQAPHGIGVVVQNAPTDATDMEVA